MRRTLSVLLLCACVPVVAAEVARRTEGPLVLEGIPEIPEALAERLEPYQNSRAAGVAGWAADGSGLFIVTRFAETAQVHVVAMPGGARRQLTFSAEPVGGVAVCPDPEAHGFLYLRDVGGAEFYQVYWYDLRTGRSTLVSDGRSRNSGVRWSLRGDRFVYSSTRRNGRDADVYVAERQAPDRPRRVTEREGSWGAAAWSPDGRTLLVVRAVSANESHPYLLDLASGQLTALDLSSEPVAYGGWEWSRDGRGLYFTSDAGSEFKRLRYLELASRTVSDLTPDIPWDVGDIELSPDGSVLAFTVNEDGYDKLYLLETATRTRRAVPGIPAGQIGALRFDPRGARLALSLSTPKNPGDAFVLDVASGQLVRWTFSEAGGLDTSSFVEPTLVRYPTFDTVDGKPRQIPCFVYKPSRPAPPYPVLISIHGGPEGQFTPGFNPMIQFYVAELGVAVLAPNVRGSTGYGKTYVKLDNGFQREDAVADIGALLDWVATQPDLDASRVAVMGGSYGGYMTLAAATHYNDRLRCAVDVVGISNFVTFLKNTQAYRRDLRRVEYGDERDPEMRAFLERISPLTNADRITRPLLVVAGRNDPRVPVGESEQIVRTVRSGGGEAWYLEAANEGHGFAKKSNRDVYERVVAMFLERFLLPRQ